MKKFYYAFCFLLAIGFMPESKAQDIHFSQFYMSPLNLNPAMTGVMECNQRLVANYRNQWSSVLRSNAFSTYSVSYDHKIPSGRDDYFGVGAAFWGDQAGESNFSTYQGKIAGSFSKFMSGGRDYNSYLVVGAEFGLAQRGIDLSRLRWGTQHDGSGGWDSSLPSNETFDRDNFLFADIGVGLLWFTTWRDGRSIYFGAAAHHVNRPNQSFFNDNSIELYTKYTLHGGAETPLSSQFSLIPNVVAMFQGPSFQLNGGLSSRFQIGARGDNQSFQIGAWVRLVNNYTWGVTAQDPEPPVVNEDIKLGADAIILTSRFDFEYFGIGFSYDINVSDLSRATNGNGAFEFSIIYNICGPERRGVYCPRF
ncbi:MAG: type IX secretion system membrane protein PorP/SprF [Saprospirales bacterium]|nr:MAG: type IX secretion system membrane protein PorP/SprF [Saprospirales bacterium]